jgi:two-component system, chemotaxis family, chemotaxis protein CheY
VAADRRRILVVEDSPMMRRLYRMVLEGYDVRIASDGAEALDLAALEPDVDLFIVDINMPRMDGLELIRRLRNELGMARVPVLVSSTESADEDRRPAHEAGATGFLPKPWAPEDLTAAVRGQLREEA